MTFIATAIAGAILISYELDPSTLAGSAATFGRVAMYPACNVYGILMALVFMVLLDLKPEPTE